MGRRLCRADSVAVRCARPGDTRQRDAIEGARAFARDEMWIGQDRLAWRAGPIAGSAEQHGDESCYECHDRKSQGQVAQGLARVSPDQPVRSGLATGLFNRNRQGRLPVRANEDPTADVGQLADRVRGPPSTQALVGKGAHRHHFAC